MQNVIIFKSLLPDFICNYIKKYAYFSRSKWCQISEVMDLIVRCKLAAYGVKEFSILLRVGLTWRDDILTVVFFYQESNLHLSNRQLQLHGHPLQENH